MNSDYEKGERGTSIVPSARKGIHSHSEHNMGRYGANTVKNKSNKAYVQQGEDVVDNVMSKMSRELSPLSTRKKNIHRSNSYSMDEEEETSDDNNPVLSKSLPTTLPSHLHYSEVSEDEDPNYSARSRLENSGHSQLINRSQDGHSQLMNRSHEYSYGERSSFHQNLSASSPHVAGTAKRQSQSNNFTFIIILLTSAIAIFAAYPILDLLQKSSIDKSTQTVNYDQELFESDMNILQKAYNIDSNSILQLKTGISTIFSRMDTGSFMFVYNSKTHSFDPSLFEKFINEVAYVAAKYLRNNISSIKQTIVQSSNLDMEEHSELIKRYKDDVDKTGVLLVKEIDGVPSDLAMAFHYYCDEHNPLVKKSAIFFTLNLANCSSNASDKKFTHELIEKCLASKWKTVPPANIRPLLARVVNIVIDVTSVF